MPVPARHLKEVVGPPQPPGDEARESHTEHPRDGARMPERSHGAERAERERRRDPPVDGCLDVAREVSRLTDRMLSQRGVGTAVRARNGRTVAQCSHEGMAAASHRGVDGDPATLVTYDRDCARDGARDDARRKYDGVGIDGVVLEHGRARPRWTGQGSRPGLAIVTSRPSAMARPGHASIA